MSKLYSTTNVQETQIELDTGMSMQVLSAQPSKRTGLPPLIFVHGSFHAAWCWTEHYFDYFVQQGYPVAALSLRGTGGTFAGEGVKKVLVEEHVSDLKSALPQIVDSIAPNKKPVLIGHSMGGVSVMKYLEDAAVSDTLAGVVTMCSVPPSGNGPMIMRFLQSSLRNGYLITVGFVLKRCIKKEDVARELFFGGDKVELPDGRIEDYGVSDEDLRRYQGYFKRDTDAVLDVSALLKTLPSIMAIDGKAPNPLPPSLVVGASRDFIVDKEGVEETAKYFGLDRPLFVDSPHDVMLGRNWKNGAEAIHNFCVSKVKK